MGYLGQFDPMKIFGHTKSALQSGMRVDILSLEETKTTFPHCKVLCQSMSWSKDEVIKFQELVRENYSYRMILDDLPSATTLPGSHTEYMAGVPLGYQVSEDSPMQLDDGRLIYETAILNHLDIKVLLHPTLLTSGGLSSNVETFGQYNREVTVFGEHKLDVGLPLDRFRIVGFEVTPRSVPKGFACTDEDRDHGFEIITPD